MEDEINMISHVLFQTHGQKLQDSDLQLNDL